MILKNKDLIYSVKRLTSIYLEYIKRYAIYRGLAVGVFLDPLIGMNFNFFFNLENRN